METDFEHILACGSEGELVSYLYGEATAAERTRFESHLLECTACTDEFAELSDARFGVYDWQRKEFAPMETPAIVINYARPEAAAAVVGWRSLLSFNWPTFAMAAALLAVVAVAGFWALGPAGNGGGQIASDTSVTNGIREVAPVAAPEPAVSDPGMKVVVETRSPEVIPIRVSATQRRPRIAASSRKNINRLGSDEALVTPQRLNRRLPSLSAEADDDDKSLRLADLFDKLDT